MARPKRQSRATENRKRRERLRRESRAAPTIAKQEKREQERIDRALLGKQAPTKVITVKPIRGKRATGATARPREIAIVSRRGQPQVRITVEPLERKNYIAISISSSWLATYSYFHKEKLGLFTTITGRQYKILDLDFETWEEWWYSHSKGTFYNKRIRNKYTITGTL